jgi:outer membrane protein assembly factor BamB
MVARAVLALVSTALVACSVGELPSRPPIKPDLPATCPTSGVCACAPGYYLHERNVCDVDAPWPMARGNHLGTGKSRLLGPAAPSPQPKWSQAIGAGSVSSPAIGPDGTIYIGGSDRKLHAFSPADGSPKWPGVATGDAISSTPAIGADGLVYVGSWDTSFYAVDATTGTVRWTFGVGETMQASPVIAADGVIYFGSDNSGLFAIKPDRTLLWSYSEGWGVRMSPAIGADGVIYAGAADGGFRAINPGQVPSLRWKFSTGGGAFESAAAIAGDVIYVSGPDGRLYALGTDGSERWRFPTGSTPAGTVASSPAIGAGNNIVCFGSSNGSLYALNATSGTQRWALATGGFEPGVAPIMDANGMVLVGSTDGNLYAVDAATGARLWTLSASGPVRSSPAIGPGGMIYVVSGDGTLYAFGP